MTPAHRWLLFSVLALACLCASGCGTWVLPGRLGGPLDRIGRHLDEYGTVTMSAPLFAKADETFAFNPSANADTFYKDARNDIQGAAAQLTESSFVASLFAGGQFDPTLMSQYLFQVQQFRQGLSLQSQADALRFQAAQTEYSANLQAAMKETDPLVRQQKTVEAKRKCADAIAPASPPTPPVADSKQDLPALPKGEAKGPAEAEKALSGEKFAGFGDLIKGKSPVLSDRASLITAAGDNATKAIFSFLGDPTRSVGFAGKKVLFAVAMVSVNPGWRTRTGYSADIMMNVSYRLVPARPEVVEAITDPEDLGVKGPCERRDLITNARTISLTPWEKYLTPSRKPAKSTQGLSDLLKSEIPTEDLARVLGKEIRNLNTPEGLKKFQLPPSGPLVAAVAPMNDAQVLDLQNSERDQVALGLELAAALRSAGLAAQADTLMQYVNRRQHDTATRSENVVANAYSIAGGHFGFEIGPSLRALEHPSEFSKTADVLARQSFPVLLIIGLENMDLRPQILVAKDDSGKPVKIVLEPQLVITQTSCWHPLNMWGFRWSDTERLEMTRQLAIVENEVDQLKTSADADHEKFVIANLAEVRLLALRAKLCGGETQQYLPPSFIKAMHYDDREPQVLGLIPDKVTLKTDSAGKVQAQDFTVRLIGDNLDRVDTDRITIVGGDKAKALQAKLNASGIVVTVPIADAGAPVVLELQVPKPKLHSIYSLPISVTKESPAAQPFIQRTTSAGLDRLEFRGVSDDVLKAEIEKNKVPPHPHQGPQAPPK